MNGSGAINLSKQLLTSLYLSITQKTRRQNSISPVSVNTYLYEIQQCTTYVALISRQQWMIELTKVFSHKLSHINWPGVWIIISIKTCHSQQGCRTRARQAATLRRMNLQSKEESPTEQHGQFPFFFSPFFLSSFYPTSSNWSVLLFNFIFGSSL